MRRRTAVVISALVIAAALVAACALKITAPMSIDLSSTAFTDGDTIPQAYTCQGEDISPDLAWTHIPTGTQSLVLIMDDPDAPGGTWVHWVLYNLPVQVQGLPAEVERLEVLPGGGNQGRNSFQEIGYRGPCPPRGSEHGYVFRLYALDTLLDLQPGAKKAQVEMLIQGHVLAQGELSGTFGR